MSGSDTGRTWLLNASYASRVMGAKAAAVRRCEGWGGGGIVASLVEGGGLTVWGGLDSGLATPAVVERSRRFEVNSDPTTTHCSSIGADR